MFSGDLLLDPPPNLSLIKGSKSATLIKLKIRTYREGKLVNERDYGSVKYHDELGLYFESKSGDKAPDNSTKDPGGGRVTKNEKP